MTWVFTSYIFLSMFLVLNDVLVFLNVYGNTQTLRSALGIKHPYFFMRFPLKPFSLQGRPFQMNFCHHLRRVTKKTPWSECQKRNLYLLLNDKVPIWTMTELLSNFKSGWRQKKLDAKFSPRHPSEENCARWIGLISPFPHWCNRKNVTRLSHNYSKPFV